MGLPKEPRQKMINMMYLVLTALLALNVSSEILNAFKVVNNSITTSNTIITDKNNTTYQSFASKAKDPQTQANALKWQPKAIAAQKLSNGMYAYLDALKQKLKKESDLEMVDGVEKFNESNLDASTRLMDKLGEGPKLYKELGNYKANMLALLNPAEYASEPELQKDITKAKAEFLKTLPIDLNVPQSQTGNKLENNATGWTTNYFHMTPTIAGLTILSKFQNDVKNSESQMVDFFHKKIGEVEIVYDKFQALAIANANYVMPGDEIEVTAGVGAFSAAAKPKVTIAGSNISLNTDGAAVWKTTASGAGERSIPVVIEFLKPDGTPERVTKTIKYTIGTPSGASVFLQKMNVLYVGVDNPMTISGGSVGAEKVRVVFPGGTIARQSGDSYVAKPNTPGMSEIQVIADGKTFKFPMRLKRLPPPTGFVGGSKFGAVSAATIKAQGGVIARLEDSEFEAPFRVVSYRVGAVGGPIQTYIEAGNDGNRWSGTAATIVSRAGPGTNLFFDQIRVIGPDGRTIEIAPMQFKLQ